MPPLRFARVATPFGPMLMAATERGLASSSGSDDAAAFLAALASRFPDAEQIADPDALSAAAAWLGAYLRGERNDLPPVDLGGLPSFDAAVYEAVREVAYGATATYGEIAAAIGRPLAARAVGGALGRCPLFPAVPCHRIVRAVDGVSGWGGDLRVKRRLLALESRREPVG
jgi:O-6-methylguanine DNA methyltransferase